jgi:6-phosphogluconolactonase
VAKARVALVRRGRAEVAVFGDAESASRAAAAEFVELAREAIGRRARFAVALSGGGAPRRLFELLALPRADGGVRDEVAWARVDLFWSDERHVPPDHEASNFRMADETLVSKVPVPRDRVHRIEAELEAEEAARRYESSITRALGGSAGSPPRFDLVYLGLGDDAHTASLFPGSAALHASDRLVAAPWVEHLQAHRVTFTPALVNAARHVTFLVFGEEKAAAVARVLEEEGPPDVAPARIVRPMDGRLRWVLDRAAARRLRS